MKQDGIGNSSAGPDSMGHHRAHFAAALALPHVIGNHGGADQNHPEHRSHGQNHMFRLHAP